MQQRIKYKIDKEIAYIRPNYLLDSWIVKHRNHFEEVFSTHIGVIPESRFADINIILKVIKEDKTLRYKDKKFKLLNLIAEFDDISNNWIDTNVNGKGLILLLYNESKGIPGIYAEKIIKLDVIETF